MTIKDFCKGLYDAAFLGIATGIFFGIIIIAISLSIVVGNWIYYSLTDKPITTQTLNIRVVPEQSIQPIDE